MRNDLELDEPAGEDRGGRWGFAVHCVLMMVVLAAAGFCFYECARIANFEARLESYGGKPLPPITEWMLKYRAALVMLAAFLPCAGLATFAVRERWQAISALVGLMMLAALHAAFVHLALWAPTVELIKQMGPA